MKAKMMCYCINNLVQDPRNKARAHHSFALGCQSSDQIACVFTMAAAKDINEQKQVLAS